MENQVTNNANALRLFFTEDVFLVADKSVKIQPEVQMEPVLEVAANLGSPEVPAIQNTENEQISEKKIPNLVKEYPENAEKAPVAEEPVAEKVFKFLGGNKKSVLILVNDKNNDVSTEQGRELLRKIVKAVELATPDFALLNYASYAGTNFIELHQFFKPQLLLAFGVNTADLNLDLIWQHEIIVHETTRMIFAPELHQLDGDLNAKKSLWGNLKKL
ncbi:hypothetical protein [Pedobacter punctiformis]|uniref:Uncharacterized protein n=1 Tax=Pedobacter punctiformis TaxID=3004097 RepID=A0ABT4LBQ2_9SPHI|nr:hypothetical protein [Pedobacter sp. HCMS5-2]MCZ4245345.1 hypothetical protein [Pedobacter sp. HCMS5-2]